MCAAAIRCRTLSSRLAYSSRENGSPFCSVTAFLSVVREMRAVTSRRGPAFRGGAARLDSASSPGVARAGVDAWGPVAPGSAAF
jgi:hypothetical protein